MRLVQAVLGLVLGATISTSAAAAPYLGVQYQNQTATHSIALSPTEIAGLIPQANFNVVAAVRSGSAVTSAPLADSAGVTTDVTVSHIANESWVTGAYSDPSRTYPNAKLLSGASKHRSTTQEAIYTFNNVPDGVYDLIVYTANDQANVAGAYTLGDTTFHVINQQGSAFDGTFIQAFNTDPDGTKDVGNYIQFDNISPVEGAITMTTLLVGSGNGIAVSGFQLVAVPEPAGLALLALGAPALLRRNRRSQPALD